MPRRSVRRRVLLQPFLFLAESWNGIDEHLLQLSNHCDRARLELALLVHDTDGPQTPSLAARAGMRPVPAPYPSGASAARRLAALRALHAAEGWDLVHLHSPTAAGLGPAALAARLAGVPATLVTYHQVQPDRHPWRTRAINRALHAGVIRAAIAVSHGVRSTLIANAGIPGGRIAVIPNGVDVAPGPAHHETCDAAPAGLGERGPREIRIGYFGRLSPEKGVDLLLDAVRLLADRLPTARTFVVGEGPERLALEARAESLGLAGRVRFLGFRADARALMRQVDIVLHVPRYEGQGLAVVEAMAAERPVVASDAPGGLSEVVVDGETGLLVSTGSAAATAEAVERLAADPRERERLGRNGRRRVEERFAAQCMAARTLAVYDQLLGAAR
jgi:glycosyltransferase involved in cell wall biosynthesis